jgi:hypothetical protein
MGVKQVEKQGDMTMKLSRKGIERNMEAAVELTKK